MCLQVQTATKEETLVSFEEGTQTTALLHRIHSSRQSKSKKYTTPMDGGQSDGPTAHPRDLKAAPTIRVGQPLGTSLVCWKATHMNVGRLLVVPISVEVEGAHVMPSSLGMMRLCCTSLPPVVPDMTTKLLCAELRALVCRDNLQCSAPSAWWLGKDKAWLFIPGVPHHHEFSKMEQFKIEGSGGGDIRMENRGVPLMVCGLFSGVWSQMESKWYRNIEPVHRVGSSKHTAARIERCMDASLGDGDTALLHSLVHGHPVHIRHLIKLINTEAAMDANGWLALTRSRTPEPGRGESLFKWNPQDLPCGPQWASWMLEPKSDPTLLLSVYLASRRPTSTNLKHHQTKANDLRGTNICDAGHTFHFS